jgi:hypothetical protein
MRKYLLGVTLLAAILCVQALRAEVVPLGAWANWVIDNGADEVMRPNPATLLPDAARDVAKQ